MYLEKVTKQEDFYENLKWLLHLYLLENCHKYTIILGFRDSSKAHDTQFFFFLFYIWKRMSEAMSQSNSGRLIPKANTWTGYVSEKSN